MNYPKLPEDFKKKWIEALESGRYEKGKMALKDDGCYCCLGVAMAVCDYKKITDDSFIQKTKKRVPEMLRGSDIENPVVDKLVIINDNTQTFKPVIKFIKVNL